MFASLLDYGKASGIDRIYFRSIPQETDNTVNWSISVKLKILKFIAIEPKKSGKYSVVFIVHANLNEPSGAQVDSIEYEYTSSPAMLNEWLTDDYHLINKVSKLAYADIAEHIINEFLLIWHPSTTPPVVTKNNTDESVKHIANTEQNISLDGVPYYSIKPAYQLRYPGFFSHEPYGLGLQAVHPVKSNTPVVEWQQFPKPEQISNSVTKGKMKTAYPMNMLLMPNAHLEPVLPTASERSSRM